jgi:hypothetical protein
VSRLGVRARVLVDGLVLGAQDTDKSNKLSEAPLKVALESLK